jgi:hypothetical protein
VIPALGIAQQDGSEGVCHEIRENLTTCVTIHLVDRLGEHGNPLTRFSLLAKSASFSYISTASLSPAQCRQHRREANKEIVE